MLCACALLAACGGGSDGASADESATSTSTPVDPPTSASSTTEATTSTTIDDEEAAILAAVDGYYESFVDMNAPPDPTHPGLERYRAGEVRELALSNVQERLDLDQAIRLPTESQSTHTASVASVDGAAAVVRVCSVDDSILYDIPSDVVLNDDVLTFAVEMHLALTDVWRVTETIETGRWEGAVPCVE